MSEIKEVVNDEEKNDLVVGFKKPFIFEGKEYTEVDLSGIENLTGKNLMEVEKRLRAKGIASVTADLTADGLLMYAAEASKMPIEFFEQLPIREARKVKVRIMNFFWE